MSKKIITISRQHGSGGRIIGQMVAQALGIAFYDKELIRLVAKESGFALDFIEETGEYSTTSILFNAAMAGAYGHSLLIGDNLSLPDKVYILQSRIIKDLAHKESCVIVGRSADTILKDQEDALNVFIHADIEHRIARAVSEYGIPAQDAEHILNKRDKARANHYRHYSGQTFGIAANYHISLDSGKLGLETCRDIIVQAAGK